ncbi:MAG TPA: hypothetical protein VFS09_04050 [Candidatus Eisenbacteria bacterium]|nr:hypothetical protein [Candidatus Eisenbacteria bacterium]
MARRERRATRKGAGRAPGASTGGAVASTGGPAALWLFAIPILVGVVLNLPALRLGYFWDDFYFLTFRGGQGNLFAFLLPDAHADFYRPIPLGVYFKLLRFLDPVHGVLAHALNLAALAASIALLVALVSRLAGPRAGFLSGLIFAGYGHVPGLVAWISCSQDLLALLFLLAAFLLRHRGNDAPAFACAVAALLCKEPAITAFPVLAAWDSIVGRPARNPRLQIAGYAAAALGWALVHPGIHQLVERGFRSGTSGYVGIGRSERTIEYVWRYVLALANVPPPGLAVAWWWDRAWFGLAALLSALAGFWLLDRRRGALRAQPRERTIPLARIAILSASFAIPALAMPALLVRHWSPYFVSIASVGAAILAGAALSRRPRAVVATVLALFFVLGIWSRGLRGEREWILSEPLMAESAASVRALHRNVESLFPAFPKGSEVVVSVEARGIRGIRSALIDGQALSLWYSDPSLRTVTPMQRRPGAPAEFLIRVTGGSDVIAVDPGTGEIRTTQPGQPALEEFEPLLVAYARAVAAGGSLDRAVGIMERLRPWETGDLVFYHRRLIASMLLAGGRREAADSLLATLPPYPPDVARTLVFNLLANASPSEPLDLAAFEAFGLSAGDPAAIRWTMREFTRVGALGQAAWYARTLERLAPGDGESAELLRRAERLGIEPRREPSPRLARPGEKA